MANFKHGDRVFGKSSKLYEVWYGTKRRCYIKSNRAFKDYGARGIKVCEDWLFDYSCFKEWALSSGYLEGLTLDRINNNGNYEPSNCRWVSRADQQLNKRDTIFLEYKGEKKPLREWARFFKEDNYNKIRCRYFRGLTFERIFDL